MPMPKIAGNQNLPAPLPVIVDTFDHPIKPGSKRCIRGAIEVNPGQPPVAFAAIAGKVAADIESLGAVLDDVDRRRGWCWPMVNVEYCGLRLPSSARLAMQFRATPLK